ncbi:lytic polysaccharide monooxygenase [Macrolepiota fuliginosa MF-IS2]|uniref:lytic cellulose monooxygenase (C4-dehydrogenating) n=1 Tax=Macrolepiota fuliginosa MF-IS2 TaxID=1400762 RepID=A0A9P5XQL7_9AGAR|nr:lytic polysaccharide monooxygenase [Macrolepiota fuliginosa MF-IS2]
MSLFLFTILPFLLSTIQGVAGHGFVHWVNIGGQDLPAWNPFNDPYLDPVPARLVRKVQSDGPVPGTDPNLACGIGGDSGTSVVADVAAGAQVAFKWDYWPADHQGPVSTYMASCDGDCTKFSANGAKWFKVDAGGYDPSTKQWAADQLRASNNTWTSTVPAGLQAGQYLMRNEIVALHSQTPQFYPSCASSDRVWNENSF